MNEYYLHSGNWMSRKTILHYKSLEKLGAGGIPTDRVTAGKEETWL